MNYDRRLVEAYLKEDKKPAKKDYLMYYLMGLIFMVMIFASVI